MKNMLFKKVFNVTTTLLVIVLLVGYLSVPANAATHKESSELPCESILSFGCFERDGNEKNGVETLWWEPIAIEGDYVLFVTVDAIDSRPFHSENGSANWATCDLRSWLNNDFYNAAFSDYEKQWIAQIEVTTCIDPYSVSPSYVTTVDKIFLLSTCDVEKYFNHNCERICYASRYAADRGAYVAENTGGSWWLLRDGGDTSDKVASVNTDGSIDYDGGKATSFKGTVRPAMWLYIGE